MILPARRLSLSPHPREDGKTRPDLLEIASDSVLALSFEWQMSLLGGGGHPGQVQNAMKGARTMALKLPPDGVWSEDLKSLEGRAGGAFATQGSPPPHSEKTP